MEEGSLFECMKAPDFSILQEFLSPPCLEPVDDPRDLELDGLTLPSIDCCLHTTSPSPRPRPSPSPLTDCSRPFPPDGGCAGPRACDRFLSDPFGPEAEAGPAASCDWPETSYQVPEFTILCLLEEAAKLDPATSLIASSASQTSPGSAEKHAPNTDFIPPPPDSPPDPTPARAMVEVLSPSVGAGCPLTPHPHIDCPSGPCVWSGRLSGSVGWFGAMKQVGDSSSSSDAESLVIDEDFGDDPVPGGVSPGAGSMSTDPVGRSSSGEVGDRGWSLGVDTWCRSNFPRGGVRMTSPSYSRSRNRTLITDWSRAEGSITVSEGRRGLGRLARQSSPGQEDPGGFGGVYRQAANGEQYNKLARAGKGQSQADRDPGQTASAPGPGSAPAPTPGSAPAPTPGSAPAPTPGSAPAPTPGSTPAPTPGSAPAPGPGGSSSHGQDSGQSITATIRTRTPRKQATPRRSAERGDPTFEGVTLRMERQLVSDQDCRLHITAHYSPGLRQKLGRIRNLRNKSGVQGSAFSSSEEDTAPNAVQGKRCASCNTLKTPLWRDAEDGTPLCNACGIRYKKYRIRCSKCWHIPKKEGKSFVRCPRCGDTLRLLVNQRKVTSR